MPSKTFLTLPEAADFLGLKESYVYKLVFLKRLPYYKPHGGRLLFDRAELEALVRAGRVSTAAELLEKADRSLNEGGKDKEKKCQQ